MQRMKLLKSVKKEAKRVPTGTLFLMRSAFEVVPRVLFDYHHIRVTDRNSGCVAFDVKYYNFSNPDYS
jgi:formiminotetrahydrofolate cyclodeaminase